MGAEVRPIGLKAGDFGSATPSTAGGAFPAAGAGMARVAAVHAGPARDDTAEALRVDAASTAPASGDAASSAPPPCLIVNPHSFRASRGLAARAMALARAHGAQTVVVEQPAALTAALQQVLARRQRPVMVLAGDGTVQAIVEQLSSLPPGAWTPELLILPGGRSNLTAIDLAPGGDALAMLERALNGPRGAGWGAAVVERSALRIEQPSAPPRYGFFLCAALIDSGIRQCHAFREQGKGLLRHGAVSTAWWLLGLASRGIVGRTGLVCPDLGVDAGAAGRVDGAMRVLLATTLAHSSGLFNPYARRGAGGLRVTAVTWQAPRFWRSLPRLLMQRFSPSMDADHGYLSGACDRLAITGLSTYTLDGEKFDADPAEPVVITVGPRLRFVAP